MLIGVDTRGAVRLSGLLVSQLFTIFLWTSVTILTRSGSPRTHAALEAAIDCFGRSTPVPTRALRVDGSTFVRAIGRLDTNVGEEVCTHADAVRCAVQSHTCSLLEAPSIRRCSQSLPSGSQRVGVRPGRPRRRLQQATVIGRTSQLEVKSGF